MIVPPGQLGTTMSHRSRCIHLLSVLPPMVSVSLGTGRCICVRACVCVPTYSSSLGCPPAGIRIRRNALYAPAVTF